MEPMSAIPSTTDVHSAVAMSVCASSRKVRSHCHPGRPAQRRASATGLRSSGLAYGNYAANSSEQSSIIALEFCGCLDGFRQLIADGKTGRKHLAAEPEFRLQAHRPVRGPQCLLKVTEMQVGECL